MMKLSLTEILAVEEKLNELKFLDIPLGGLCAGFLYSNAFYSFYDTSFKRLQINTLLNIREYFAINFSGKTHLRPLTKKSVIFNITANVQKNVDFFSTIHSQFNSYQCIVISKKKNPFFVGEGDVYLTNERLRFSQHLRWIKEYFRIEKKLSETLDFIKLKYGFSKSFIEGLRFTIKIETKSILYFNDFYIFSIRRYP